MSDRPPSCLPFSCRTPTLPPATHTNSYALGGRDVLLVEPATPYPDEQRRWIEWARALPSLGRRPIAMVATHHHPDHVGGAAVLGQELGLPLWAHEATRDRLAAPVSRLLKDGETIRLDGITAEAWQVLHTPGHAPGHVCLWNASSRVLVAGDMVASQGTILIAPGDGDMAIYLEQLERLIALDPALILPAHGEPVEDAVGLLRRVVAHRLAREDKVLRTLRQFPNGATLADLLPLVYDDVAPLALPWAALSLSAHVQKLLQEGVASSVEDRIALSGDA